MVLSSNGNTDTLFTLSALISQRLAPSKVAPEQWPQIAQFALRQGVGPWLWWQLKETDIDANVLNQLQSSFWTTAVHTLRHELAQAKVQAALTAARIPGLWLKGGALAHTVYPKASLRPMCDLDVLVPYEQREQALQVVQDLGFKVPLVGGRKLPLTEDDIYQKLTHHFILQADNVVLEVHYYLLRRDQVVLSPRQMEWMWCQTETFSIGDDYYTTLKPEAHLLYLAAHAILQHGEYHTSLKHYLDLHLLIQRTSLDWNLVLQQAINLKWTYAVERALTLTMRFFETPVPKSFLQKLVDFRPSDEDVSHAILFRGKEERWERMRRTLGQLSFTEKMRLIRRIVLPSRVYMRKRYKINQSRSILPYYPYRWGDQFLAIMWWLLLALRIKGRISFSGLVAKFRGGFGFSKRKRALEVSSNSGASKTCR